MTSQLRNSGTSGRYGHQPEPFNSAAYGRYQPTKGDFVSNFYRLLRRWRFATLTESSIDRAIANEAFQGIVGLGEVALPLIVEELRTRPDLLVAAMLLITGENPVPFSSRGDMSAMATAWIDWYERNR